MKKISKRKELKIRVSELLRSDSIISMLDGLDELPPRKVISALNSHLCSSDETIRWLAVKAMGRSIARLATEDEPSARTIIRRFIWNLNEESGGTAWGAPESMAESMALHTGMAKQFARVLISFITPDGLYLDFAPLLCGAVWGIGRLAEKDPDRVKDAVPYLIPFLSSDNVCLRATSARALGLMNARRARLDLESLLSDNSEATFFIGPKLTTESVGELAEEALAAMDGRATIPGDE